MLMTRQKTPSLELETLKHGSFNLSAEQPERGTLLCFYRGLHCPACANYLTDLESLLDKFAERGVNVIAISSDTKERAEEMSSKIGNKDLTIAYGLDLAKAREWGLYISTSRGKTSIGIEEPALFSEPAVYLVRPDQSLYFGSVQTMPFTRPHFSEMIGALDFVIANDYPARGEYTGEV